MKVTIKETNNKDALDFPNYTKVVKYGIPQDTATLRQGEEITMNNASILYIMEHGSIVNNIPARELLVPVRNKYLNRINEDYLIPVLDALVEGDTNKADKLMEELAQFMQGRTQKYFTDDNGWAPNSYYTIHGGWMQNKKSGKWFYTEGKGSTKPLIDTGALRQAIRGVVIDAKK